MELRVLQYFLAVVREGNISRAAEVLHLTQPTLSRQMQQLEEELGTALFIRGRHLALTDAGTALRRRAEEVVSLMDTIRSEFDEEKEMAGVIAIGSGGPATFDTLLPYVAAFRMKHPGVTFRFQSSSVEHVREQLDEGLLHFGLLPGPVDVTRYEYLRRTEKERWGLLLPSGHPLAGVTGISPAALRGVPLITAERMAGRRELAAWYGGELSELDIFATYDSGAQAAGLVASGHAAALVPEGDARQLVGERMVFRPLVPELSMTSVLAWKKFQPNFGAAGKFLAYVKSMRGA